MSCFTIICRIICKLHSRITSFLMHSFRDSYINYIKKNDLYNYALFIANLNYQKKKLKTIFKLLYFFLE